MIELLVTVIPLDDFDQYKLEDLLRKIPTAYVRSEMINNGERKFYTFPKLKDKGFKIDCLADHYLGSKIPSHVKCSLTMLKDEDFRYDEHSLEVKDPYVVNNLYNAISYGSGTKKLYSSERVYGLGLNGKYQENFRYGFICSLESCEVTMSTKPALY